MRLLSTLLAGPGGERPRLAEWIAGRGPTLLVDGGGLAAEFPGARVLVHATSGGPGLPFAETDARRIDAKDGEFGAVVLAEVLDKLLDVGSALAEARRVLGKGGALFVVQTIAPDDFEERALWNAIARLTDARHTWAPSAKQLAGLVAAPGWDVAREAAWTEAVDVVPRRGDAEPALRLLLAAAPRAGGGALVEDGRILASRRATLLVGP